MIPVRVIPAICFDCPGCGNRHIRVDRNLPDITRTCVDCQVCHAQYDVLWDDIIEDSRVVEKDVKLVKDTELIPKERVFYCPDCDTEFSAIGYANPVFYADTVANCLRCGGKCWEATVKITLSEYERLKRIGAKLKTFN